MRSTLAPPLVRRAAVALIAGAAGALVATATVAQEGGGAGSPPMHDPRTDPCPASGFAKPIWGTFGGNDGITHPYEIAGPCSPKIVQEAAMAMGTAFYKPLGLKAVQAIRFSAKGLWVDAVAGPIQVDNLTAHIHFYYPAARFDITGKKGTAKWSNVEVVNDERAWDETTPGVGPKPAPAKAVQDRSPLIKLLPQGAMLAIIEAEGTVKISKDKDGKTVITGKSPYDSYPITVTLNAKNRIEKVVLTAYGHTYTSTLLGYNDVSLDYDPLNNKWEPAYFAPFVDRMVWTKDGKVIADLSTTEFKSNPYTPFPLPELLKADAEKPDPSLGFDKNNPGDDPRGQFNPDLMVSGATGAGS